MSSSNDDDSDAFEGLDLTNDDFGAVDEPKHRSIRPNQANRFPYLIEDLDSDSDPELYEEVVVEETIDVGSIPVVLIPTIQSFVKRRRATHEEIFAEEQTAYYINEVTATEIKTGPKSVIEQKKKRIAQVKESILWVYMAKYVGQSYQRCRWLRASECHDPNDPRQVTKVFRFNARMDEKRTTLHQAQGDPYMVPAGGRGLPTKERGFEPEEQSKFITNTIPDMDVDPRLLTPEVDRLLDCSDMWWATCPSKCPATSRENNTGWTTNILRLLDAVVTFEREGLFYGVPFIKPVAKSVPSYHSIVSEPMDFSTIYARLHLNHYPSPSHLKTDIDRIWRACDQFNRADSPVSIQMRVLKALFEKLWEDLQVLFRDPNDPRVANKATYVQSPTCFEEAVRHVWIKDVFPEFNQMDRLSENTSSSGKIAGSAEVMKENEEKTEEMKEKAEAREKTTNSRPKDIQTEEQSANDQHTSPSTLVSATSQQQSITSFTSPSFSTLPSRRLLFLVKWKYTSYSDVCWEDTLLIPLSDPVGKFRKFHQYPISTSTTIAALNQQQQQMNDENADGNVEGAAAGLQSMATEVRHDYNKFNTYTHLVSRLPPSLPLWAEAVREETNLMERKAAEAIEPAFTNPHVSKFIISSSPFQHGMHSMVGHHHQLLPPHPHLGGHILQPFNAPPHHHGIPHLAPPLPGSNQMFGLAPPNNMRMMPPPPPPNMFAPPPPQSHLLSMPPPQSAHRMVIPSPQQQQTQQAQQQQQQRFVHHHSGNILPPSQQGGFPPGPGGIPNGRPGGGYQMSVEDLADWSAYQHGQMMSAQQQQQPGDQRAYPQQ
eukprot:GDKJ01012026.1.p1 GENE.GDKJ01012026.1~~GDKJ01012026.1.p1  ORF type:complete len:832 (-),score=207.97 GDKJ01012026.1:362-2836(-)